MCGWMRTSRLRRKKRELHSALAQEIETEAEHLIGKGVLDDFHAAETEARRVALPLMRQAIARRLNADHGDDNGPRLPCECGAEARLVGHRPNPPRSGAPPSRQVSCFMMPLVLFMG